MLVSKYPYTTAAMNRPIDFVYFDLGNILVSFDPQLACQNVAKLLGVSNQQVDAVLYKSGLEESYERGEVTADELVAATTRELNVQQCDTQIFLDAIADMFQPIESMQATIEEVRASGCRIGILSNTCFAHWDWLCRQRWPVLAGPFDVTVLSYEVGAMKPDPRIYEAAEAQAGISPEQILFIDDKQENVDAAVARGWNAVQCFGGPDAQEQLKAYGVVH